MLEALVYTLISVGSGVGRDCLLVVVRHLGLIFIEAALSQRIYLDRVSVWKL